MEDLKFSDSLDVGHIDFRVARVQEYNGTFYAQLLAYKDARVDMFILDTICTPYGWQNEYRRDSQGVLQCGIGVHSDNLQEWVWKWSNGVPSNFEGVKGEYSDAFKRAGFMWGIGRDLYDYPQIRITLNESEVTHRNGEAAASYNFTPNKWDWVWKNKNGDIELSKPDDPSYSLIAYQVTKNGSKVERYKSNPHFSMNQR